MANHPMFDNSFSPQSPRRRMSIEELFMFNEINPQQVVDYGKLRCNETVEFLPSNEAKAYNLRSYGYDHIFIACKRNGELDYIWLGQFTAKDWNGNMIYPQIKGDNHLERRNFLAGKTLTADSSVSEYKNYWDGCTYKYAKICELL
jgi:hypothetical protein